MRTLLRCRCDVAQFAVLSLLLAASFLAAGPALGASTVYTTETIENGVSSALHRVNVQTADSELVHTFSVDLADLASQPDDPQHLLAVRAPFAASDRRSTVYRLALETGALEIVDSWIPSDLGYQGEDERLLLDKIAVDPADATRVAVAGHYVDIEFGISHGVAFSFDLVTGEFRSPVHRFLDASDLATTGMDWTSDGLFLSDGIRLVSLDLDTGDLTPVGPFGGMASSSGLAFHPRTGNLYTVRQVGCCSDSELDRYSPIGDERQTVGSLGFMNASGLAFAVPEPASAPLVALGVLLACSSSSRSRQAGRP